MNSDTVVYIILGIITCIAFTAPLWLSSLNDHKDSLPKPRLGGRRPVKSFKSFPIDEE